MDDHHTTAEAASALRTRTAIAIPVYLLSGSQRLLGAALLDDTVRACTAQLDDARNICLSVDGEEAGADEARELADDLGLSLVITTCNCGKLAALRSAAKLLLDRPGLSYLAVLDCDADHFPNELLNFVRCGEFVRRKSGAEPLILGQRQSRHCPMGFLRGELEELADRVLLDALAFRAAVDGSPMRLECATSFDEFPDFHSGYKLFSAELARRVFASEPEFSGVGDVAYYRHACEAVMVVEALVRGGYLGVVRRSTMNEQPVSTFGLLDRCRLVADKIIWPCKRLQVPPAFVDQWLRNHIPRLLLSTLSPDGADQLARIRGHVLEAFGIDAGEELWGPPFV